MDIINSGLIPDPQNANQHTQRGRGLLEKSLRQFGGGRSILADKNGVVIAGNATLEGAAEIGLPVRIVETDGNELVVVKRTDLDLLSETDKRARQLAYADNKISELDLSWSNEQIAIDFQPFELDEWGFSEKELISNDEEEKIEQRDVPDAVWPSDNDMGIPLLDSNLQGNALDLPFLCWGAAGRSTKNKGTWHFYTQDYRYEALWKDPSGLLNTGCVNIVEPNFSCYDQMPVAVALWQIYRKRWMARWWQSYGVRVFVDLNVADKFADINLLGVPKGWKAWATRSYIERIALTEKEYQIACDHAGTSSILFVVYGGGKKVSEVCKSNGWLWFNDQESEANYG